MAGVRVRQLTQGVQHFAPFVMGAAARSQQQAAAAREKLIIVLDFETIQEAEALVSTLGDSVSFYKIGLELACGGALPFAQDLIKTGKQVFLDLKLHDIPTTVGPGVCPGRPSWCPVSVNPCLSTR
jgi:Orotidine 5'-phosphate decarboxylase / HUMPS family